MERRIPINQIMIATGTILGIIIAYYEEGAFDMDIALTVAIIGVAGGLWGQVIQGIRESGKIRDVGGKVSDVGGKVSDVGEKVSGVGEKVSGVGEKVSDVRASTDKLGIMLNITGDDVKKIKSDVVEKIVPGIKTIADGKQGIDALVDELNYQKRLKNSMSGNIVKPDYLFTSINGVYEENAKLAESVREYKEELQTAELKITALKSRVAILENENRDLKLRIDQTLERNRADRETER